MPLYVCRWENGDFSVVQARSKDDALEMLDEVANAEGMPLYPITDFMVHFQLSGDGTIKLEGFGDDFWYHITADHAAAVVSVLGVEVVGQDPKFGDGIQVGDNQCAAIHQILYIAPVDDEPVSVFTLATNGLVPDIENP